MAQRYTYITWTDQNDRPMVDFEESKTGDWVKYDDHAAEITQLRADLAESRASEHGLFGRLETCRQDEAALKAELEQEREARESSEEWADIGINLFGKIIYEFDACVDDSELTDDPMENYLIIIRQAIKNATRRNK